MMKNQVKSVFLGNFLTVVIVGMVFFLVLPSSNGLYRDVGVQGAWVLSFFFHILYAVTIAAGSVLSLMWFQKKYSYYSSIITSCIIIAILRLYLFFNRPQESVFVFFLLLMVFSCVLFLFVQIIHRYNGAKSVFLGNFLTVVIVGMVFFFLVLPSSNGLYRDVGVQGAWVLSFFFHILYAVTIAAGSVLSLMWFQKKYSYYSSIITSCIIIIILHLYIFFNHSQEGFFVFFLLLMVFSCVLFSVVQIIHNMFHDQ